MQTKEQQARAELIRDAVGPDELAEYLVADSGERLGVYVDGDVIVGDDVGNEIAEDERPVAWVRCPGLGNIDMAWWRNGWDCAGLTEEEVIRDCCENGDVADEILDLVQLLIEGD
jgi:hypothetical protein